MFTIEKLRVEYMDEPLGIDVKKPMFSWIIKSTERNVKQQAYKITVSEDLIQLLEGKADMFDSGKITSNKTASIEYAGKALKSCTRYYWQVEVFINDEPGVSETGWFETAFLDINEFKGDWIGMESGENSLEAASKLNNAKDEMETKPSPIFRKDFEISKQIKSARAYITGLGYYEMFINGEKADDRIIEPGQTDPEMSVLYSVYDITHMLEEKNAVGIWLGRGRYAMTTWNVWGWQMPPWRAESKFKMHIKIEYTDGTNENILSDTAFKCTEGPILSDSLYTGEVYDARCEKESFDRFGYNDKDWQKALIVDAPKGSLHSQTNEPIKVVGILDAVNITKISEGRYVFDFGVMTAGICALTVSEDEGTEITIKYGEKVIDDGTVWAEYGGVADGLQIDKYICNGSGLETYIPKFSYKGFQYIEVEGLAFEADYETVKALVAHNDVEGVGYFDCSNQLFNTIHGCCTNAMLNNYHSIPTDTPVYEKNGWTGDAQLTSQAAMYNFDMIKFYKKWIRDIAESQIESGEISVICPTSNWGYEFEFAFFWGGIAGPVPAWDAALMLIPKWCMEHYGDTSIIKEHYTTFKKYMEYIKKWEKDGGIIDNSISDWLNPSFDQLQHGEPPEGSGIVGTAYYYMFAKAMVEYAEVMGSKEDTVFYESEAVRIRNAGNAKYYAGGEFQMYRSEKYGRFRQTSNAFAAASGLVEDENKAAVTERLAKEIMQTSNGHLDVGIVGTKYLYHALCDNGWHEIAYTLTNKRTYPSFGFMIENGATALWEAWELCTRSLNHHMFGSVEDYFYQFILGIKSAAHGFKKITIKPCIPNDMQRAKGYTYTIAGKVASEWIKQGQNKLRMTVEIPANTTAEVYVPIQASFNGADVTKSCKFEIEDGFVKLLLGSGTYIINSGVKNGAAIVEVM